MRSIVVGSYRFAASVAIVFAAAVANVHAEPQTITAAKPELAHSSSGGDAGNRTRRSSGPRELVFVDTGIADWRTLAEGVADGAEVVRVGPDEDGLTALADALDDRTGIRAVHILSHGESGAIRLGNTRINRQTLDQRSGALRTIRSALAPGADILLAGCRVAAGDIGLSFVERLAAATSADVAASVNDTGASGFGADWSLERSVGSVETAFALDASARHAFRGRLEITSEVTFGFSKYDGSLGNGDPYNATIEADGTVDQMTFSDWRIDEFDDPDFGVNMNNGGPNSAFSDPAGANFQFVSFTTEVFCGTSWSFDVVGYKDGSPVAGASESYSLGGVGGPTTHSVGFASVDEVRFENYATDNGNQCVVIDDIVVDQEVVSNTAPSFSNLDATVLFDEAAATPVVIDADATVSDTEHDGANDYGGSTLTVAREGGANADDDFGFDTGAGTFTVSGGDLLTGGNVFASFTDNSGTLTVSFNSNGAAATSSLVDDVLQGVTYANTGNPVVVEYGLTLNFDDGGLQTSDSVPVEYDPELAAVTASTTYDLTELGPELSNFDPIDARIITESTFELLFHGFRFGDASESGSIDSNELQLDQVTSDAGTTGVRFEADEPFSLESIDIDNFSTFAQDVVVHAYLDGSLVDSRSFSYGASSGYQTRQFASANAAFGNVDEIRVTTSVDDSVAFDNIVVDQGNDPPTLDLDTGAGGDGATATFSENAHQGNAASDGVTVTGTVAASDADGTIETATINLDNAQGDAGEGLAIDTGALAADLGFSTAADSITITRNTATNAELVEAIEAVRYQNDSDTPDTTARTVTVEVTDDLGATASATATVSIEAGNDAPTITGPGGTLQPDEDTAFDLSGANEIQIADVDAGGATVEVSLSANNGTLTLGSTTGLAFDSGSNGTGAFIVSGTITDLNAALATLHYQGDTDYSGTDTVSATVNDRGNTGTDPGNTGDGSSEADALSVSLDVQPVPDAPTITAIADQSTDEDTTLSGIAFTIDDAETAAGSLTLSFSAGTPALNDSHSFGGSGANRTLEIVPADDQNGSTMITVEVSDGSLTATADFQLTVNPVNDPPTVSPAISTLDTTVDEDAAVPAIGLAVDDVESGGAGVTATASSDNQTLVPDANLSVTDNGGGDRTLDVALAPDENGSANITVTLDDGTDSVDDSFTLTVNAVNDAPAVSLDQNSDTIAENNGGDVTVARITIDDDNEDGSTNNLSLTGPDAGDFAINGTDLDFTGSADFEAQNTYDLVVEIDDPGVGGSPDDTAGFTLSISDLDETPTFSATGPFGVSESAGNGAAVGDVDAADGDGGATDANLTYAIVGGNTGGAFAIDAGTGAITLADASAVDFDTSPTFSLDVEADDGTNAPTATVTVNVDNAAPSTPVDSDGANGGTVAENVANDTEVGITADAADPAGGNVSYALTDNAGGRFQINAGTGVVTVADGSLLDFESASSHTIGIRASDDDGGDSGIAAFTVAVTDVNEVPTISGTPEATVAEDSAYTFGPSADDPDAGETLTFAITNRPAWAAFDTATGALTGTPANDDVGTYPSIEITVTDSEGATDTVGPFSIEVTNTNDAPRLAGTPPAEVIRGQAYTFTPTASDVDDGDTLTFTLSGAPDWLTLDPDTGALGGTPGTDDVGTADGMVLSVSDGTTDVALPEFSITVLGDLDGDGVADRADDDVDGDGIPGDVEAQYGLDDRDPTDAGEDLDGDGLTNLEEYQQGSALDVDSVPPVVTPPADIEVDATGLFTEVDLGEASAMDVLDGEVAVDAPDPNPERYRPGRYEITWSATDAAGNTGEATQTVDVRPIVSLGRDRTVAEGETPSLKVFLNGDAPVYPVTVPYTVRGSAANPGDHDLTAGTLTINSGRTASRSFTVVDDGVAGEGPEDLVVELGSASGAALADRGSQTTMIVERNLAPTVKLTAWQQAVATRTVVQGGGPVSVTVDARDVTALGDMALDWSGTDNRIDTTGVSGATLTFDPAVLSPGVYRVAVAATDDGRSPRTGQAVLRLRVVQTPPQLGGGDTDSDGTGDADEGYGDSDADGLPDYRDAHDAANLLAEDLADDTGYLMEADPGLSLRLGPTAFAAGGAGSRVSEAEIRDYAVNGRIDEMPNVGGYFSFAITGLPEPGDSARLVIPQRQAIPERAVYRKLLRSGSWQDFVADGRNHLASAPGEPGYCPPPDDPAYEPGLETGHWCVRVTIEDGGPNDSDGSANGTVTDPGGVARGVVPAATTNSGGGGLGWPTLLLLGLLTLIRVRFAGTGKGGEA